MMKFAIIRKSRYTLIGLAVFTAIIPIAITAFELVTTDKESVVFLEGYPTPLAMIILAYYLLLVLLGFFWFVRQLVALFRLKNEKARAELLHLKNQVNPHFFFNTLNNLYGLVESDSKKAQQLILKLSDLMRYSIYECEKELVKLGDEVSYLKNYIELHKMRYQKKIEVNFDCQIEEDCEVIPLLFIILLENAFKHGVEKLRENAYIGITLTTCKDKIRFTIENNYDNTIEIEPSGIGLKNLRRRLELAYPKKHILSFAITEDRYEAQLMLERL